MIKKKKRTFLSAVTESPGLQRMICAAAFFGLLLSVPSVSAVPSKNDAARSTNIALDLSEKFLYNVNREANSITVFKVDGGGKGLTKEDEVPVGREPVCVAVGRGQAFVVNAGSSSVSVVERTGRGFGVVGTIPVGPEPRGCALTPDGKKLYVAGFTSGTVTVIDAHSKRVSSTIKVGGNPWAIAIVNNRVFVTDFFARLIKGGPGEGFDDGKQGIVKSFLVNNPGQINEMTLSPLADSGFTANRTAYCKKTSGNNAANDTFCPDTNITDPTDPKIAKDPQGVFPNQFLSALACRGKLYLPNIGAQPEPPVFFNANVQALVDVVDVAALQEREDLHVNLNAQIKTEATPAKQAGSLQRAFGNDVVAIDSDDECRNFFIISRGGNYVLKAQLDPMGKLTINAPNVVRFQTGNIPTGIVVDRKGRKAYVNNEVDMTVSVIDLSIGSNIGPAPFVAASTPPEPGSVEHARLMGKIKFFTALGVPDTGLVGTQLRDINPVQFRGKQSDSAWSSCASCHNDGLLDGVTWIFGDGARQTIALDGLYSKINGAHDVRINNWSAPRDSATDFNNNSRNVQCGTGFAGGDAPKFCNPASAGGLPNPAVRDHGISQGASEALDMETAWLQTTVRAPNQLKGPNADAGRDLFDKNCASCHGGAKWTKSQVIYLNNPAVDKTGLARDPGLTIGIGNQAIEYRDDKVDPGLLVFLEDVGTFNPGSPIEIRSNPANAAVDGRGALGIQGFNVPSLLGVNSSAPYFHNGQARTLDEVFAQHKLPGGATISTAFSAGDLATLANFLKALDGSTALLRNQTDDFKDPFVNMKP
jgi:YVTN family beta-propeller protein